ncbi:phage tail protein [Pokkaliibacter sp. CJK22405]|uniref:phage tail protein n=1 Tax=Pokkaliibacter sp. CJK22405 TaxID=3384615 RepID=UPI0039854957
MKLSHAVMLKLGMLSLSSLLLMSSPEKAAAACGTESYMADICTTAASFCPRNTMEAKGQLLSIAQYTALFSLIGTQYGGNGTTNFQLPDLQGRLPMGEGAGPGLTPRVQGQVFGNEQITQTLAQMPAHTHMAVVQNVQTALIASTEPATSSTPSEGSYLAAVPAAGLQTVKAYVQNPSESSKVALAGGATVSAQAAIGTAGASQPMNIMPPTTVLRYCVVTAGIFPSRP